MPWRTSVLGSTRHRRPYPFVAVGWTVRYIVLHAILDVIFFVLHCAYWLIIVIVRLVSLFLFSIQLSSKRSKMENGPFSWQWEQSSKRLYNAARPYWSTGIASCASTRPWMLTFVRSEALLRYVVVERVYLIPSSRVSIVIQQLYCTILYIVCVCVCVF